MGGTVLQVDSSMRPLTFCSWPRAVNLLWEGKAIALEVDNDNILRSPSISMPMPLVIQLPYMVKLRPLKDNRVIKRVLFARDGWQCQYCSVELTSKTATIDHVIPKAHFIKTGVPVSKADTWENCTAACQDCNSRKGDKLPYQCSMYPKTTPKKPDYVRVLFSGKSYKSIHAKYVTQYYPLLANGIDVVE